MSRFLPLVAILAFSAGRAAAQPPASPSAAAACAERSIQRQLERAPVILGDWPNLARYREANAVMAPLAEKSIAAALRKKP